MKPPLAPPSALPSVPVTMSTRVAHAVVLRRAAPVLAQHAERVRVVDHDEGAVALGEIADLREGRDDAVHREHAVGGDQDGARALAPP